MLSSLTLQELDKEEHLLPKLAMLVSAVRAVSTNVYFDIRIFQVLCEGEA